MNLQKITAIHNEPDMLGLLNCLRDFTQKHGELGKPFDVLRGLIDITIRRVQRGEDLKIASTALQVEVAGVEVEDKNPGTTLASPWKTLTEHKLVDRREGLQQFFAQHEFNHYLWPMKDKSHGGAGNTSMYYFEVKEIPVEQDIGTVVSTSGAGEILYIPELTPSPAWWLKRLFEGGYALQGWRRWLLVWLGTLSILAAVLVVMMTLLLLAYSKNLTLQIGLNLILFAAAITWLVYLLVSPIGKLLEWRIITAPDILVSFKEYNVLIELASDPNAPDGSNKVIRLVRYASTCPICSGKVEVVEGKKEFPNRFVGRCLESPAEHVFSFDRVTRRGKLLR